MTIWEPNNGEFLKIRLKPEYELDEYAIAVIKTSVVVGHFAKRPVFPLAKCLTTSWALLENCNRNLSSSCSGFNRILRNSPFFGSHIVI